MSNWSQGILNNVIVRPYDWLFSSLSYFVFPCFSRDLSSNELTIVTKDTFRGLKSLEYL